MLTDHRTAKMQGNVGVGMCIAWLTSVGLDVAIPLTDSQAWDLIAEIDGNLQKIQCKTSYCRAKSGGYTIDLRITQHSNQKMFCGPADKSKINYYFILTNDGSMYFIPISDVKNTGTMTVGKNKWTEYEVTMGSWENGIPGGCNPPVLRDIPGSNPGLPTTIK